MRSWYNKNRRHYGPKPFTRRARGLRRRDVGKKHKTKPVGVTMPHYLQVSTLARYFRIYNLYCKYYEEFMDADVALTKTVSYSRYAGHSEARVKNAIRKVEEFKKLNNL